MKKVALFLALFSAMCMAQTDNTFYAKQFPGADVGTKIKNAQLACSSNTKIACIIMLDPSLSVYPPGTLPSKCAQCTWFDYRNGNGQYIDVTAEPYSAACDGVTLDDAALSNAEAQALATGYYLLIPAGRTCAVSTTFIVKSNMMANGATLTTTSDITPLQIGDKTGGASCNHTTGAGCTSTLNVSVFLPNVTRSKPNSGWTGTTHAAVEIASVNDSNFYGGRLSYFYRGLELSDQNSIGNTNNNFYGVWGEDDFQCIALEEQDNSASLLGNQSWVNSNHFWGGRCSQESRETLPTFYGTLTAGSSTVTNVTVNSDGSGGFPSGLTTSSEIVGSNIVSPQYTLPDGTTITAFNATAGTITLSNPSNFSSSQLASLPNTALKIPALGTTALMLDLYPYTSAEGAAYLYSFPEDGNTFYGVDVENMWDHVIDCVGCAKNRFNDLRYDNDFERIRFRTYIASSTSRKGAFENLVDGGYNLEFVQVSEDVYSSQNNVLTPQSNFRNISNVNGDVLANGANDLDPAISIVCGSTSNYNQTPAMNYGMQLAAKALNLKVCTDSYQRIWFDPSTSSIFFGNGATNLSGKAGPNIGLAGGDVYMSNGNWGLYGLYSGATWAGWNAPHLIFGGPGETVHVWFDPASSTFRWKTSTPTSATDGAIISAPAVNGGSIPASSPALATNSLNQIISAPNTYGCSDGYDHLPCTLSSGYLASTTALTSSVSVTTITLPTYAAGAHYRITLELCTTTLGVSGDVVTGSLVSFANDHSDSTLSLDLANYGCRSVVISQPSNATLSLNKYAYLTVLTKTGTPQYSLSARVERY